MLFLRVRSHLEGEVWVVQFEGCHQKSVLLIENHLPYYRDYYCAGPRLGPIGYCGVSDLRDVNFNDQISSWFCESAG